MVQIKLDFEKIVLAVFFGILLFIGPGNLFGHKIMHDFPYGYYASDPFQHQIRAEAIKDAGNFKYEAFYISRGFDNIVGRYPPLLYHIAVIFSYSSGLEVYDSIYFVVMFFAIIAALVMYFIIRDFNKRVALISLPITILMISHPVNTTSLFFPLNSQFSTGFIFGHWPSMLAQFFLVAFTWCVMKLDLEKSYIFISIILISILLTHTSEAVFAGIFLVVLVLSKWLNKNLSRRDLKKIGIFLAISFIAVAYYIIIFKYTWAGSQPYTFSVDPIWNGNPGFYIFGFGILLIFIIIGIFASLTQLKNIHVSLVFGFSMLLAGFMNYIGFQLRSFQIRFFWPIYLSVFFGFGIYFVLRLIIKNWNMTYSLALFAVFSVLILGIIKIPGIAHYSNYPNSAGLMDQYHWESLKWISGNTEKKSKILFFYGDIYSQDALLRNTKRSHYQVDTDEFVKSLQEKKIERNYVSEIPGDTGGGTMERTGLFSFHDPSQDKPNSYFFGPHDICGFDYLVFDKVSNTLVLAQYNLLIANDLLKKDFIKIAFENQVVVILKNTNIGADCIEERNF
ncbi:MAG: hypothetical protein AABX32_04565 [Nanoarchaeota archaeon]